MNLTRIPRGTILIALVVLLMQSACLPALSHTEVYHTYLLLRIDVDRSRAKTGEAIHIRFTTRNTGSEPIILESPTTPVMDVVVVLGSGPDLLSWSTQNPDKVQHRLEWKPGETKIIEWVWIPRPEDIAFGYYQNAYLSGRLYQNGRIIQSAGVEVCASNYCR